MRFLLLGDSLTAGQVPGGLGMCPPGEVVRARLDAAVVRIEGQPLGSVRHYPRRLRRILAQDDVVYEAAVVLGGTNDLWRLDAASILASLEATAEAARGRCRHVTRVTLPPFAPSVLGWFGQAYVDRVEGCRLEVNEAIRGDDDAFDLAALCDERPDEFARDDGIHLGAVGYRAFGLALSEFLLDRQGPRDDDGAARVEGW